ncbi:MAG: hypothetical protein ACXVEE_36735 [Polyangiales bacterium]
MKRALGFLFLVVTGCGGTTSPAAFDDAGVTDGASSDSGGDVDGACAAVAKARCTKLGTCSATDLTLRFGDEATCESREKEACVGGLSAPSSGSTPSTAQACAAALGAASCTDFFSNTPIAACAAKVGGLANGAPCGFASQCQSTHCAVPRDAACGTCAPLPKIGDMCGASGGCGSTLHCGKDSNVCSAFAAKGAACDKDVVCDVGLGCVQAKGATMGTCQSFAVEGAACDPKSQTAPQCDRSAGLWCSPAGTCAKISSFAKKGEPCGLIDAMTYAACSGGSSCVVPMGGMGKGTCQGPAELGAPCDPSGSTVDCVQQLRCVGSGTSGTCVSPTTCK